MESSKHWSGSRCSDKFTPINLPFPKLIVAHPPTDKLRNFTRASLVLTFAPTWLAFISARRFKRCGCFMSGVLSGPSGPMLTDSLDAGGQRQDCGNHR